MRILIADALPTKQRQDLEQLGYDVTFEPALTGETLPGAIDGHQVLIVRSTVVSAETVNATEDLSLIVRAGAGTNTIDTGAAAARGIFVCNTPGKNSTAVAELTMGLLLAIDRNIPDNVSDLRRGLWDKKRWSHGGGLQGKSIGIVGVGAIGLQVAMRAQAFGMEVLVIDRPERPPDIAEELETLQPTFVPDIETLVANSDVITFHVPSTDDTFHMIDKKLLSLVKPGAIILNTARGELIDDGALLDAIEEKGVRVGLDVYNDEPSKSSGPFGSKLAQHPSVYGTHHIGASTDQAQEAVADEVVSIVDAFAQGEVRNCVNLEVWSLGTSLLTVRHQNRVGVLAQILAVLRRAGLNVEFMENKIFAGAVAGSATIHVTGTVEDALLADLKVIDEVIAVEVSEA